MRVGFIFSLILSTNSLRASDCGLEVTKDLIGPGAVVVVKNTAKPTRGLNTLIEDLPKVGLAVFRGDGFVLDGGLVLPPGTRLVVDKGPWKIDGQVNVVQVRSDDFTGKVYWNEFKRHTELIEATAVVKNKKPAKPKFPRKFSPTEYGEGKTFYGSDFPKVGDIIWAGSSNRVLSLKLMGRITEFLRDGKGFKYQSLLGTEELGDSVYSAIMEKSWIDEAVDFYGSEKVKVDWWP